MPRALVFFALTIGSLFVPVIVLWYIVQTAPFPYERTGPDVIDRPFDTDALAQAYFPNERAERVTDLGGARTIAGVGVTFEDGVSAKVAAFQDVYTANLALEGLFEETGLKASKRTSGGPYTRVGGTASDGKPVEIFAWTEDRWLFLLRAPSREALESRIAQLSYLKPGSGASLAERLLHDDFPWLLGGFLLWVAIVVPTWARAASWAAVIPPKPSAKAVDRQELLARLRALGGERGPFEVRIKDGEAVIDWRTNDPRWTNALAESGAGSLERVQLRLDEDERTVRVRDEEAIVEWAPPDANGRLAPPKLEWSVERAIFFFERRRDQRLGIAVENGVPSFDDNYKYEFDSSEMKEPLIALMTQSGWSYRPVISFRSKLLFG
jgi:hypothetical protein